jgi:glucuronoarabinoxylan endo-1,4-beta-xylanase
MDNIRRSIYVTLGIALSLTAVRKASAQTATVDLTVQKQYIRGYGGMVHIPWAGDLSAAERTLAFGNADGQLGFSMLRIAVPDSNTSDSSYAATAKAAIAAGGIVFASPWNSSGSMNSSEFSSYASHLNAFVATMKNQGAELYAISVQNEPDYGAQAGWRSWTAAQCHDFVLNYGATITTKLIGCESFNYAKSYYDPILNDSAALANVAIFGTHLYGTPVSGYPYPLFDSKGAGKERWMTEHYTDSNTDANSWPNALNVATELHNSMVEAQFNGYTWWYIKRSYGPINNGAVTKRGWCMAHWSKFVRPGFYRVDATKSPTSGVSLSAFKGPSNVVIVAVNTNSSAKTVTVSVNGSSISSYDSYTTSSSKSLAKGAAVTASNGSLSMALDASSVTTLNGTGTVSPGGGAAATGGAPNTGGSGGIGGSVATGGSKAGGGSASIGGSKATGGTPSVGGASSVGGTSGVGGSKATGGTPVAGGSTGNGGSPQVGGSKAVGGSTTSTGGVVSATGGSLPGSGGSGTGTLPGAGGRNAATGGEVSSTGGVVTSTSDVGTSNAGSSPMAFTDAPIDSGGCSCRVAGERGNPRPLVLFGILGMLGLGSVRRRQRNVGRS